MGSALAYRPNVFASGPFIIGSKFSYPFFANLLSAILIKLHLPFFSAFILPSLFFSLLLIFALFYFYKTIFQSDKIAILASNFFLLNGGIGFFYFFKDLFQSDQPFDFFLHLSQQYTRIDVLNIKYINVIDSMIFPQRAFNHGCPITLIALAIIYPIFVKIDKPNPKKIKLLILSAILIGLLPIIHTHSFLASIIILVCWSFYLILQPIKLGKKNWIKKLLHKNEPTPQLELKKIPQHFYPILTVGLISLIISMPILYLFFFNHVESNFFQFYPGWLAKEYQLNWFVFWWRNWTIVPLTALISWIMMIKKNKDQLKKFVTFLPFFLLFILANLVLFQPFPWDNTKVLVFSSLGFSGLNAWLMNYLIDKNTSTGIPGKKENVIPNVIQNLINVKKLATISLIIIFTASGTIDAYYQLLKPSHQYVMYSAEDVELAEWVKNNTSPASIWLTGDKHNHWLFNLTGRQAIMTYPGWLWTHGYDYVQTYQDVRMMYQNPDTAQQLFANYNPDYIIIGEQEIKDLKVDKEWFDENLKVVKQSTNYKIYQFK